MRAGDQVEGTIGRELVELVETGTDGDGNPVFAQAVHDKEMHDRQRITNVRLANIQALLQAIFDQNQKGVKTKAVVSLDLVAVPELELP